MATLHRLCILGALLIALLSLGTPLATPTQAQTAGTCGKTNCVYLPTTARSAAPLSIRSAAFTNVVFPKFVDLRISGVSAQIKNVGDTTLYNVTLGARVLLAGTAQTTTLQLQLPALPPGHVGPVVGSLTNPLELQVQDPRATIERLWVIGAATQHTPASAALSVTGQSFCPAGPGDDELTVSVRNETDTTLRALDLYLIGSPAGSRYSFDQSIAAGASATLTIQLNLYDQPFCSWLYSTANPTPGQYPPMEIYAQGEVVR